ncbi:MAG: hypothetical protein IJS65_04780, partial [Clostridia bacterium]|nr:hypothetical protein [Clostridia bacterium]
MTEEQTSNNIYRIFTKEPKPVKEKPDLRLGDPDEVLTVSRGLLNENGRPGKSTPWTDDDNNSVGALFRLHVNGGFFEKGRIKRRDIDKMKPNGGEIFLQHEKLIDSHYLELYGEAYIKETFQKVGRTYWKFADLIDRLRFAQDSSIHGRPHEKRVLLLCLFLALEMGLSEKDTEALAYAAAYHDTGRVNDFAEEAHGEAGAKRYKRREKENFDPAVYFVIK